MIDSHCHLNFKSISDNFDNIINNAINNNVSSILSINTNPKNFYQHLNLINKHQNIFISYGLHPCEIDDCDNFEIDHIINNSSHDKVIGIGETGLDFYHSTNNKKNQYKIFETHIKASIETGLPLIIHQRNSELEIIDVLKSFNKNHKLSIVFHCFTGSKDLLNFCIDNNFFISLSGIVTFKNANNLREVIKNLTLDLILIETDSPFLSPVPLRGQLNEPGNIKYIAEYLANFYNLPLYDFVKKTDNNFYKLFSKAKRYTHFE